MFEDNELSYFYDKSYESIIYSLFKKECSYSEGLDPVVYWCGQQYMNIFLNLRIPLKQIFVVCPISKIESYYDIYHEQNGSKLIDIFLKDDYLNSIIKILRKKRGYSLRELSLLTNISINTLKYYECNQNLYAASFKNVSKILNVLEYSYSIAREKTDYIPNYISLLTIDEIKESFENYICSYYSSNGSVELEMDSFWFVSNRRIKIDTKVVDSAIVFAIEKYKDNKLLF